jgi:hypothetical protein
MIPFFQPQVIPDGNGHWYLAEDHSFCYRARQCGFRVMADTTIRMAGKTPAAAGRSDTGFIGTRSRIDPEATTRPSSGMTSQIEPGAESNGHAAGRL